jgi:hypothetical protein
VVYTVDPHTIYVISNSYRQIPVFGRNTIRRFSNNCSELKKMAARDFEDLLQVSSNLPNIQLAHEDFCSLVCYPGF